MIITGSMAAGSVRYYAACIKAGTVAVDTGEQHLPLRHSHHRYAIAGPNGVQQLTVPLMGETNAMPVPLRDVRISEHAAWRRLHWGALFSAYGRTPYFDYVAADLEPVIMGSQQWLLDYNEQLQQVIVDFMDLPIKFVHACDVDLTNATDLRRALGGKKADTLPIDNVPYYQVWQERHGFLPGLSILDLMMNMGREGIFTLLKMTQQNQLL
ncbi:MAG: WbqC family protein [Bacteroidales bacterium]|nr:WbqC family protein [Candidatus Sodaliphilus fimicaballi]